jgi:hypothetical protein
MFSFTWGRRGHLNRWIYQHQLYVALHVLGRHPANWVLHSRCHLLFSGDALPSKPCRPGSSCGRYFISPKKDVVPVTCSFLGHSHARIPFSHVHSAYWVDHDCANSLGNFGVRCHCRLSRRCLNKYRACLRGVLWYGALADWPLFCSCHHWFFVGYLLPYSIQARILYL